jgi:mannose-1-phosphate guanylyltransferase
VALGTRFWPKSRASFPKQFLDILGNEETLIQSAYKRYASFILPENIYIITSQEYVDIIKDQLPDIKHDNILAEPSRKNTGPMCSLFCFKMLQQDPDATFVVAPSDHIVTDIGTFDDLSLEGPEVCLKKIMLLLPWVLSQPILIQDMVIFNMTRVFPKKIMSLR